MSDFEPQISQFGLVNGFSQPISKLITLAMARNRFGPEARKGQLILLTEALQNPVGGSEACQLAAKTMQKAFYADSSYSVTSALREASRQANKALHQYNLKVAEAKQARVSLTCAVLKDHDLFLAQIAPAQALLFSAANFQALPLLSSWEQPTDKASTFLYSKALGASLFIDPELHRLQIQPGDTLIICSSNLAPFLREQEQEQLLLALKNGDLVDKLLAICYQGKLTEAHALAIYFRPKAHWVNRNKGQISHPKEVLSVLEEQLACQTAGDAEEILPETEPEVQIGPDLAAASANSALELAFQNPPLALGESLAERWEKELTQRAKEPASSLLGESTGEAAPLPMKPAIDLSDMPMLAKTAQPYRPRHELRALGDLNFLERLVLPFSHASHSFQAFFQHSKTKRNISSRIMESSRFQARPFPWFQLLALFFILTGLIFYGSHLSYRSVEQQALGSLDEAERRVRAIQNAPDLASAQAQMENARKAIDYIKASPFVTETNTAFWVRYLETEREYELALSAVQKLTFFDNPVLLTEHPFPNGQFTSLVVPPANAKLADPIIEARNYIYALDTTRNNAQLFRIRREGGAAEPFLSPNQSVKNTQVGTLLAQAWRLEDIVAVDQTNDGFGYYFRTEGNWNHLRLGRSNVWGPRTRLDLELYEGNLYVWGAETGEILKFSSGHYGEPPQLWLDPNDTSDHDLNSVIDMAVDGKIYLLQPTGHVLVMSMGRFEQELVPEALNPPLTTVTHFFLYGPQGEGWFFLLDPLNERIIQMEQATGKIVQQIRVRPDNPLQLTHLTAIAIDNSSGRPEVYLANGHQILKAALPAPPRLFNPAKK